MPIDIAIPDIGDFHDIPVIEVLVKPGDTVALDDSLVTLESDKATMDVPSPASGTVRTVVVKPGDKVSAGTLVLTLEAGEATPSSAPVTGIASTPTPAENPTPAPRGEKGGADAPGEGPSATPPAGQTIEVRVPHIGDFHDVPVIEVFVKPGDIVKSDDPLVTLESDKATMEVPSPIGGVIEGVRVSVGQRVSEGTPIVSLKTSQTGAEPASRATPPSHPADSDLATPAIGGAKTPATPSKDDASTRDAVQSARASEPNEARSGSAHASPSVRRYARELGADISRITGSGPKGRILESDVQAFIKRALGGDDSGGERSTAAGPRGGGLDLLPWPTPDFAKFGPVEAVPLSRIRKISGANLARNWVMIPHVTQFDDADITELEALRVTLNREYEKAGVKITMLAFLIKAAVAALRKFPDFNASLDARGDTLLRKGYFNIGFAADTPNGLVVPVIKGVAMIAREMTELSAKAREGKLGAADMQGGCFSVSSLGGIGGTAFTPIVNAPEVAILGVSKSAMKPVWDGSAFVPKLMLPLSLSYDHRVIDGAAAARFTAYFASVLADFRRVLV
ncbi:MAG TPA: dihydrolipoyllysine-residue acetyltransferase [Casimicrobiaceae bacterium]|nr:dihydrolipoyllysine-residue acetyltransferase [Casimicrobiaceae bacterium]